MNLEQKLNKIGNLPSHQLEQIASNAKRMVDINIVDGLCEDFNPDNEENYGESFDDSDTDADYDDVYNELLDFTHQHKNLTRIEQIIAILLHSTLEAVDHNNYDLLMSADSLLGGMGG